MSDWKTRYAAKIATAEDAVRLIPPRKRILIGSGAAEPGHLVEAMVAKGGHLEGNEIVHLMTLGSAPYVQPGLEGRFRHTAFFIGANVRSAVQEGRADFMPVFLSEIPQLITSGRVGIDAALIEVSEGGMRVAAAHPFRLDDLVQIAIPVPGGETIATTGRVVHAFDGGTWGLSFELAPIDVRRRLARLAFQGLAGGAQTTRPPAA